MDRDHERDLPIRSDAPSQDLAWCEFKIEPSQGASSHQSSAELWNKLTLKQRAAFISALGPALNAFVNGGLPPPFEIDCWLTFEDGSVFRFGQPLSWRVASE